MNKKSVQQQATDGSPARATGEDGATAEESEDMRQSRARASRARIALWGMGLYPFPIVKGQRRKMRADLLESLPEEASRLTVEDLMALYLVASLWRFFPATSPK